MNVDNIPIRTYHELSLSNEGRFLEGVLKRTEQELAGPGAPKRSTAWSPVERREALRLALGARGSLAARGGYVNPASKGASQASWRLPPLHPLARVREGLANLGRFCAARIRKLGCLNR